MRCHQFIGLSDRANTWLILHEVKSSRFYATEEALFSTFPLVEYTLVDGTLVKEIVQDQPWSSGPVTFTCLEYKGKKVAKWTRKEIQEQL